MTDDDQISALFDHSFPARTARVLVRASRALHLGRAPTARPAGSQ